MSKINFLKSRIFERKDKLIIGIPMYKLYIDEYFLSSFKNLKAIMQLPALLKPGRKARHWKIPTTINLMLLFLILNLSILVESDIKSIIAPIIEV